MSVQSVSSSLPADPAGLAASAAGLLRARIGGARMERDFFDGATIRAVGGDLVVRVCSQGAADVLASRYGPALNDIAKSLGCSLSFACEPSAVPAALRSAPAATVRKAEPIRASSRSASLESIVVTAGNRLAVDAARRAGAGLLPAGSLVYIHAGCGLGKSHLLAGAADAAAARPGTSARCVSGEQFANEFIGAIKSDKPDRVERFRRQHRSLDLLCIDDVGSLANKHATQQELQHTIDAVLARGGRVLVAAGCAPRRLEQFSDAMVSRLLGGLVAEILPPDAQGAAQLVRALAARRGLTIEPPAADSLAHAVLSDPRSSRAVSVRDLEGMVNKVEAVHRLLGAGAVPGDAQVGGGGAIGMLTVSRALADRPAVRVGEGPVIARIGPRQPVRLEHVVELVCRRLSVTSAEVAGRGRHPRVVLARAVATLLSRRHTRASYPEIARALGRPNHSTVITAHQRLEAQLAAGLRADCADGAGERPVAEVIAELAAQLTGQAVAGHSATA